jgi:hypothetical protein
MTAWQKITYIPCLTLAAFLVSLSGCDNEEALPLFYSVEVDLHYSIATEEWLFATDSEGNILDAKPVSGRGITIQLNGSVGSVPTFTLHHMVFFFTNNNPFISVQAKSYTDVPVGGTWHLTPSFFSSGQPSSIASVTINDYHGEIDQGFTHATSVSSVRGNEMTSASWVSDTDALFEFKVRSLGPFIVSSLYEGRFCHYGILNDVVPQAALTITLQPMDQPLMVDLPNANYINVSLSGYYDGDDTLLPGYINCAFSQGGPIPLITAGYVNGFDKYKSFIMYNEGLSVKFYENLGAPLTNLPDFDEPELSVSTEMITSLAGSISIPYDYAMLDFQSHSPQHFLSWTVWRNGNDGTSLNFKLPQLPEVIASRFPLLKLQQTRFTGGYFVQNKDGYQYADKLDELADQRTPRSGSAEYFSYRLSR